MQLKRIHDWDAPRDKWCPDPLAGQRTELLTVPSTGEIITSPIVPPVKHVRLITAPDKQHFTEKFLNIGQDEGWLVFDGEVATITTDQGAVKYRCIAVPGRYCVHCGQKLEDDDFSVGPNGQIAVNPKPGEKARQHVAEAHPGAKSPDKENPAGYRCDRFYVFEKAA